VIALLQRVSDAEVTVGGRSIAAIGAGAVALVGIERSDGEAQARRLAERVVGYRLFADARGRMNLDVGAAGGALLLVPQFTLAADTRRGNRPSFTPAADPAAGARLFARFADAVRARHAETAEGEFGAHMVVSLSNDGPVTFWLQATPGSG